MKTLAIALAGVVVAAQAYAEPMMRPNDYPQPKDPSEFNLVIEIPQGSFTKYELDDTYGYVKVDRFQSMPVVYPANYGSVPSTIAADGDPLDAMVYTREPIVPGAVIKVRPIGVLHMIDGGEEDNKIIGVPVSKVDPTYDGIKSIDDLPAIEQQRLQAFFRVYKDLPEGRKKVELNGFGPASEAIEDITKAVATYREKHPQ